MSTSKLDTSGIFKVVDQFSPETRLALDASEVRFRKNGIEFRTHKPLSPWTEMDVDLQSDNAQNLRATGVVVACNGNRHSGYVVTMILINLSQMGQENLDLLAFTQR
jgi:hypothetical protein